ncbi:uncharacterized protein LOC108832958 [Raphanus sativus]|uniref:Uncharacterized protein LOC108832958 n=1 Tax=Raphanus sativus TaxID=3726 RepID=A0A6J0LNR6_RAPSA|nr:uncharacterized protein LOC108832958 [Raphanus sativus]
MDETLAGVMQGMSLEDDVPIVLPEDEDYSAVVRNSRSLLGRFLNPPCQNMARMLRTMPKIWKVYERVRGIALTKESFQFIFELESDIQTVLKQGFWTFDDWGMALDRWVEYPPSNFLQTSPIWIRISNIPVNYLTIKTIDAVAGAIGYVKDIEWDPEKPLLQDYIRVQIIMDLSLLVREKKSLTLPKGGGTTMIDIEYERIRKKCFHCFRLSHEKKACPIFNGNRTGGSKAKETQISASLQRLSQRQHNYTLSKDIMPLLAPSVPPGFEPPTGLIAPEVFEQMQLYMNCIDPEERRIREFRMKKALDELSKDPLSQRAGLRMEDAPVISKAVNKDKGLVFDFSGVAEDDLDTTSESSSHNGGQRKRINTGNTLALVSDHQQRSMPAMKLNGDSEKRSDHQHDTQQDEGDTFGLTKTTVFGGFEMGSGGADTSLKNGGSKSYARKASSWTRRGKRTTQVDNKPALENEVDGVLKRKADGEAEVTSKLSKSTGGLMVHQKPSNPQ